MSAQGDDVHDLLTRDDLVRAHLLRLYYRVLGGHVHCRMFTSGKNGDVVFGLDEWPSVRAALERSMLVTEDVEGYVT